MIEKNLNIFIKVALKTVLALTIVDGRIGYFSSLHSLNLAQIFHIHILLFTMDRIHLAIDLWIQGNVNRWSAAAHQVSGIGIALIAHRVRRAMSRKTDKISSTQLIMLIAVAK